MSNFLSGYCLRISALAPKRAQWWMRKLNEQFLKRYCLRTRVWAPKRAQWQTRRLNEQFLKRYCLKIRALSSKKSTMTNADWMNNPLLSTQAILLRWWSDNLFTCYLSSSTQAISLRWQRENLFTCYLSLTWVRSELEQASHLIEIVKWQFIRMLPVFDLGKEWAWVCKQT